MSPGVPVELEDVDPLETDLALLAPLVEALVTDPTRCPICGERGCKAPDVIFDSVGGLAWKPHKRKPRSSSSI